MQFPRSVVAMIRQGDGRTDYIPPVTKSNIYVPPETRGNILVPPQTSSNIFVPPSIYGQWPIDSRSQGSPFYPGQQPYIPGQQTSYGQMYPYSSGAYTVSGELVLRVPC
ncbi:hypothetical protein AB6A40_004664 [Gnathostoma spinigerum]|uniref:Uncharacterized protein n=1 Tax=Gnathostoma spinigerum TaxID=75299 RepID=A0ABD6ENV2_9BILA